MPIEIGYSCGRRAPLAFVLAFGLLIYCPTQGAAQSNLRTATGESETIVVPAITESWSATSALPPTQTGRMTHRLGHFPGFQAAKGRANQTRTRLRAATNQSQVRADLAQATSPQDSSSLVFEGPNESDTDEIPPDPQVAAGPNNVVVLINSLIAIYDKSGNAQGAFQPLSSFFSSLNVVGSIFDPRIIYDDTDNRFILTAAEIDFTNLMNGNVLVAVSQTSDPTGIWNKFAVDFEGQNLSNSGNTFPDFPTLGLSSLAIYISTGQFTLNASCISTDASECSFSDTWIKVIGLAELLSGSPALNITTFQDVRTASGAPAFSIEPAVTYGTSSAEFLVAADFTANPGNTLNVFSINTSGTPSLSAADLPVPQFGLPPDATQPDNSLVATNDFRLLNAVWSNNVLWTAQNVGGENGNAIAQWYEISAASLSSVALKDSGTISGSGDAYFPEISVKPNGDVGVAFTTSSVLQFASSALTGRASADAAGAMRSPAIYRAGTANYSDFALRWGDYSGIGVDPDGNSIWMISEYAGSPDPHFGTAVAQMPAPPALSLSALSLDFGTQPVGFATQLQTLTVTNAGSASLTFGTLTISGADPSDFAISSDSCSKATLGAHKSCALNLTFTPSTTGSLTAALSFSTNPASFVPSVQLTGQGQPVTGTLVLLPQSLTFPDTPVREVSARQPATLTNVASTPFTVGYIQALGAFAQTNNCGSSLAAGKSCVINVTFRPAAPIYYSDGSLAIFGTNLGGSFISSNLSGTGVTVPKATPCPTSVNFGNQAVGSKSASQLVTLSNTGSGVLTVTSVKATGDFTETNGCDGSGSKLPPETACAINVTFAPTATGTRTGTLTITDNAAGSPHTVQLTGSGVATSGEMARPSRALLALSRTENSETATRARASRAYGKLPLSFEANQGQASPDVKFISRGSGYALLLTSDSAVLALDKAGSGREAIGDVATFSSGDRGRERSRTAAVRMELVGANPEPGIGGLEELPGKTSYFKGSDPARWHTHVPSYEKVLYRDVYPGVDLVYYGNQQQLEYDFVLNPRADPRDIRLRVDTANSKPETGPRRGRTRRPMRIAADGDLVVSLGGGEVRFRRPVLYQTAGRAALRTTIEGHYILLDGKTVGFRVGTYDKSKTLVIDPELSYSTYLGGNGQDTGYGIAVDSAGSAYITGSTASANFPTANAFQSAINHTLAYTTDAFVTKLSADGSTFLYSTFLGGSSSDFGSAITVDASGSAYVAGYTFSSDFPVTSGALQTTFRGGSLEHGDAFVTKLSADGSSLVYSTYLGGSDDDEGHGIALDSSGDAWVGGLTNSEDFPVTAGAFQTTALPSLSSVCLPSNFCGHGFLAKLNPTGSGLLYGTYLAGGYHESVQAVAVDPSGDAFAAGFTMSNDFPTTAGAFQTGLSESAQNAFVAKFSSQGALIYSTYLGGDGDEGGSGEQALGIAVDTTGSAYITGNTNSIDFPVFNAYQASLAGVAENAFFQNAFVAKLHPAGCALTYSTYLGGSFAPSAANAIAVDSSGDAFITGQDYSQGFPVVNAFQYFCSFCDAYSGNVSEPFVAEFDPSGSKLVFSSFLAGSNTDLTCSILECTFDQGLGIAVDSSGNAYVTGQIAASDFPTVSAAQRTYGGHQDAFVTKISPVNVATVSVAPSQLTFPNQLIGTTSAPQTLTVTNQTKGSVTVSSIAPEYPAPDFSVSTSCGASIAAGGSCTVSVKFTPTGDLGLAELVVNVNAFGGAHGVRLYGVGITGPVVSFAGLSGNELDFGGTPVGTSEGPNSVTLMNTGRSALTITSIAASGDFSQTNNCTTVSPEASCTISVSFKPTAGGNRAGTVTVNDNAPGSPQHINLFGTGEDFSLSSSSASQTVSPGQSANYTLTITPLGGFAQAVTFACSGAPQQSACTTSPSTVTLDGADAITASVTVTTTAPSNSPGGRLPLHPPRVNRGVWLAAGALFFLLLAASALAAGKRRALAWAGVGVMIAILLASCGGGGASGGGGGRSNPGTPAGSYTITVTAMGGSGSPALQHTATLTLIVN